MPKILKYTLLVFLVLAIILGGAYLYFLIKNPLTIPSSVSDTSSPGPTSPFSIENAPTESLKGEISTMSGEILWQSRVATEEAVLSAPIQIQQGEKLETGDTGSATVLFKDAVKINYSNMTAIDFIQTLPTNIVFSLDKGNAEFIKIGNSPIYVRVEHLLIENAGDLTVSINPINGFVSIKMIKGNATVAYNDLSYVSHEVTIGEGKSYTFNDGTRKGVAK